MNLQDAMTPEVVDRLQRIKADGGLPAARGAALALIRLTQREGVTLPVLAHAIKADPALSVRLVRVAGGVSGAAGRSVVSVRDAVTILGMPAVRALALGFSLLSLYRGGKCRSFDYARFWTQSLARAVALQLVAGAVTAPRPEEAFGLGLLARVGELALANLYPEPWADILERCVVDGELDRATLERDAFGVSAGLLSASMLLDGGLDPVGIEAAGALDEQGGAGAAAPAVEDATAALARRALALADHFADICMAPAAEWRGGMARLFELGASLSIEAAALVSLCDRAAFEWREWGVLLGVETGPMPQFEMLPAPAPDMPPEPSEPPAVVGEHERMCILVVGDETRVRNPLCTALMTAGHQVFEAASGRQGLAMAIELQPQILLADLAAAEMDGIELARTLRQFKIGRSIYVLVVTDSRNDDSLVRAFEAGVDDFLVLPLTPRVLAARLRAGQRVVRLQEELAREQEEIRRITAELSATNQQLQEAGTRDMLTGCPNRRYALDRLQQEWAMSIRSQRPLACMVINIDNFKLVNDMYGHDAGDTVLKLTAGALRDEVRAQDVLARAGGDEFLVICPDTTLEAASACAERMRSAIEGLPIVGGERSLRGSISVGVAVRDASTATPDDLVRLADQGAYLAKRRRNAVAAVQSAAAARANA